MVLIFYAVVFGEKGHHMDRNYSIEHTSFLLEIFLNFFLNTLRQTSFRKNMKKYYLWKALVITWDYT